MRTRPQSKIPRRLAAFSLIEIIGVMTVLVILGTILISTTPRQLDAAAISIERTNLLSFASSLQNTIVRNRYIPGTGDIANVISSELGVTVADIMVNAR